MKPSRTLTALAVVTITAGLAVRLGAPTTPSARASSAAAAATSSEAARLGEIATMGAEEQRRAAAHALSQARAVLRLSPKAAAEAARAIANPGTAATTAGILSAALATAETDEARDALLGLARSADVDTRRLGVQGLVQLRNPDDETVGALKSLLEDKDPGVAASARLALGANVRQAGGAGASAVNGSGIDALIALYNTADDDSTRMTLVYALGNAGGVEVLPTLLDALGRTTPLGEAAVYSLRYVPGDEVNQILDRILRDGPTGLRVAAVEAVGVRDLSAWAPKLAALLEGELPQEVRKAIMAAL